MCHKWLLLLIITTQFYFDDLFHWILYSIFAEKGNDKFDKIEGNTLFDYTYYKNRCKIIIFHGHFWFANKNKGTMFLLKGRTNDIILFVKVITSRWLEKV